MSESNVWAIVDSNNCLVVNTIIWNGSENIILDEGMSAISLDEGQTVSIGYTYKDKKFTAPPLTDEQKEQIEKSNLQNNLSTKKAFMDEATLKISILQDAVDLDMATDEEKIQLTAWKKYRVLLNRIEANTSSKVAWPDKPQ